MQTVPFLPVGFVLQHLESNRMLDAGILATHLCQPHPQSQVCAGEVSARHSMVSMNLLHHHVMMVKH